MHPRTPIVGARAVVTPRRSCLSRGARTRWLLLLPLLLLQVAAAGQAPVQPPTVNLCSPEKSSGREGHNGAREGSPEGSQEEDVVEMEAEEGTGVGASGKAASR